MIAALNFSQRIVSGKISAVFAYAIDVELDEPLNGIRIARINREHWLSDDQHWHVGEPIAQLFVYDLSSDAKHGRGRGHWFASLRWCKEAENPWFHRHAEYPFAGKEYTAQVISHASDFTAVLRLGDYLMDGYLQMDEVPDGRFSSIDELLPPGLQLRVVVKEFDPDRLKLSVSVLQLISRRANQQGAGPHAIGQADAMTSYLRLVDAQPLMRENQGEAEPTLNWQKYRILLIDNDAQFGKNLLAWFKQFGATAWFVTTPEAAHEVLHNPETPPTHILLDYDVGERNVRAEFLTLLKTPRKHIPVAIISGLPEGEAPHYAARFRFAFMAKPLRTDTLHNWFERGEIPQRHKQSTEPATYWQQHAHAYTTRLEKAAQSWLQAGARLCDALGLVWVRCYHPEYQLLAEYGLPQNSHASATGLLNLRESVVADAAQFNRAIGTNHANDALQSLWPSAAKQMWAIPLNETEAADEEELAEDVLLIFLKEAEDLPQTQSANLRDLRAWWLSLLALERTQQSLVDEAVFAAQGRIHAASLHELRPLLQTFQSNKQWSAEEAQQWWPQGKKVTDLVNSSLYNIRPERRQSIDLHDRVYKLMHIFLWQMIAQRQVTVIVYLPPKQLIVKLPPEVLEQPLINLIDNATKFCGRRRWAKVEVRFHLSDANGKAELVIEVRDQGSGMTQEQIRRLFHPRRSASGEKGHGLGLYVSQSLLKAVGGSLRLVESYRWHGSVFEIRLPIVWGG